MQRFTYCAVFAQGDYPGPAEAQAGGREPSLSAMADRSALPQSNDNINVKEWQAKCKKMASKKRLRAAAIPHLETNQKKCKQKS